MSSHFLGIPFFINLDILKKIFKIMSWAQRPSIGSQKIHYKGTAFNITKYQTFLTKYGLVCHFKMTFVNSKGTGYHIL